MSILRKLTVFAAITFTAIPVSGYSGEHFFPQAKVIAERGQENHHYLLPLGRVKRDRDLGRDVPSSYKRLEGRFSSTLWELERDFPLREAREIVTTKLDVPGYEILFSCEGRDCGESFAWANSVFDQAKVYGNDRSQSLWTVRDRGAQRYHVFYLVERPNRRTYFYHESLEVPDLALDADVIQQLLEQQGYVVLGEVMIRDGREPDFGLVVEKIKKHGSQLAPELLVIHRQGDIGEVAQSLSLQKSLVSALADIGVQAQVEDVSNLAPRADAPSSIWVEWVNPDWKP